MAAPIIDSIIVNYPAGKTSLALGESATIIVAAHDADARTVQVAVTVTDQAGGVGSGQVPVVISDPLTYSAVAPSGKITGGGLSSTFTFTA